MGTGELVNLVCGEVAWTVEAVHADALAREVLGRATDLASDANATLVKRSLQREVRQVALADGSRVLVKGYRLRRWKDKLKRAVFGPKPRIEWAISRRLLALGVPASHALAVGVPRPARCDIEGYLVVEVLPDVTGLSEYLASKAVRPAEARAALLAELAAFVRRLHDRGVAHHDLHAGNVLVRTATVSPAERFLVIDLHRARVGRPPGPRHRAGALAQLVQGLCAQGESVGAVAEAFVRAYQAAGRPLSPRHLSGENVVELIGRRSAVRLRSRARRCLKESTEFTVETVAGWRVWHRRDWTAQGILALRAAPGRGAEGLEVREFAPRGGVLGRLASVARRSPGVRAYAAAHRRWLETGRGPQAVAGAECVAGAERGKSFAVLAEHPHPAPASGHPLPAGEGGESSPC